VPIIPHLHAIAKALNTIIHPAPWNSLQCATVAMPVLVVSTPKKTMMTTRLLQLLHLRNASLLLHQAALVREASLNIVQLRFIKLLVKNLLIYFLQEDTTP
jgi:hypothetical protein